MNLGTAVAILFTLGTGFGLVHLLWPTKTTQARLHLLKACLAVGLGLGVSSCSFLAALTAQTVIPFATLVLDAIAIAVVLAAVIVVGRRRDKRLSPISTEDESPALGRVALVALGVGLVFAAIGLYWMAGTRPYGRWDAVAIWNLKARFLALGGAAWANVFNDALAHTDYPLLLPLSIARLWTYAGSTTTTVPQAVPVLFAFLTIGVLLATVSILRGRTLGALAALALMANVYFMTYPSWQYADIPLGCYELTALCMTALAWRLGDHGRKVWVLAGLAGGCAAWTKNEGLLFVVALLTATMGVTAVVRGPRRIGQTLVPLLGGLAPFLLVIAAFKLGVAAPNDLFRKLALSEVWDKVTDPDRHRHILRIAGFLVRVNHDWLVSLGLLLCVGLCGVNPNRHDWPAVATVVLTVLITALGYYVVYLITSHDLGWHLKTSADRLFMHLWPSWVLLVFLVIRSPPQLVTMTSPQRT
ncbi:MAG: glycosyltransferase family 39 protein, partial [Phycisphaeraceae bacterium]